MARPDRPLDDGRSFGAPILPSFLLLLFRLLVDDTVVVLLDGTVASVVLAAAPSYFGLLGIVKPDRVLTVCVGLERGQATASLRYGSTDWPPRPRTTGRLVSARRPRSVLRTLLPTYLRLVTDVAGQYICTVQMVVTCAQTHTIQEGNRK